MTKIAKKSIRNHTKYSNEQNYIDNEIDPQKQRIELLEKNNLDQEKKDMWDD